MRKRRTATSPRDALLGVYATLVAATYFYTRPFFGLDYWMDLAIIMGLVSFAAFRKWKNWKLASPN